MQPQMPNEYLNLLRHLLTAFGALMTARGYVTAADVELYTGAVMLLAPALWDFYQTRRVKKLVSAQTVLLVKNELQKPEISSVAEATESASRQVKETLQNGKH